jgi:acyl carrier protein
MDNTAKNTLRAFLKTTLAEKGDKNDVRDDESLFVSGRLDSLSLTKLVVFLEEQFGIDFGSVAFDVELVDSVNEIESFVQDNAS